MSKYLIVGDYHAVSQELVECERLMSWILDLGKQSNWDGIVFLGDQYHSFANINSYVMNFWIKSYQELSRIFPNVISLVGNHDQPGDNTEEIKIHSLLPHKSQCLVVDKATVIDRMLFMPYYHRYENWLKQYLNQNQGDFHTIFGHQTFMGATYENGFYAKDGFPTDRIIQSNLISGHIHSSQNIKGRTNIIYPGSPRWRNVNDSNVNKFLYVLDAEPSGIELSSNLNGNPLNTDQRGVCSKMYHVELREPQDPSTVLKTGTPNDRVVVDVHGSSKYIKNVVPKLSWANKIRVYPASNKKVTITEQHNIDESLKEFLSKIESPNGTPANTLLINVQKRIANG